MITALEKKLPPLPPQDNQDDDKKQDELDLKKFKDNLFNELYQAVNKITETDLNALYDRLKYISKN
jgi:hypothetical protein